MNFDIIKIDYYLERHLSMAKGILKKIFQDHWDQFVKLYNHRIRKNVHNEVKKMLECGSLENGYIEFKCVACGETKRVGFRCKSRFCTSCGKVYVDNWVEDMVSRLYNTKHKHMVFTIPSELREYFQRDRKLLKILPESAADVLKRWYKNMNKKEEYTPGIIAVIHTFGRDLKWNPHVHVMVTEGGAGNFNVWKKTNFVPYEMLRKSWQKVILDKLQSELPNKKKEIKNLKDKLYKKLTDGFYVYAKGEIKTAEQYKKLRKWKYRLLKHFGVDPLNCERCGARMIFHDINYKGRSIRDEFKRKVELEVEGKVNELIEQYAAIKGLDYAGREPLFV